MYGNFQDPDRTKNSPFSNRLSLDNKNTHNKVYNFLNVLFQQVCFSGSVSAGLFQRVCFSGSVSAGLFLGRQNILYKEPHQPLCREKSDNTYSYKPCDQQPFSNTIPLPCPAKVIVSQGPYTLSTTDQPICPTPLFLSFTDAHAESERASKIANWFLCFTRNRYCHYLP